VLYISVQLVLVSALIAVHLLSGKLHPIQRIPRRRWLSFAGGISIAYVFVHIFPELAEAQHGLRQGIELLPWLEHHAYLVALSGLMFYYGLECMLKQSHRQGHDPDLSTVSNRVFWVHIGSFTIYNALVGYLLAQRQQQSLRAMLAYTVAMVLHFCVNDYALRQHHKHSYHDRGRWVLAAAILLGWLAGITTSLSAAMTSTLFAFLAGAITLNVLKEELPSERQNRFWAFTFGAVFYTAILLLAK